MEFIPPDIFSAAVELVPAHRATLNQRRQKAAIHKLQKYSWITSENFNCVSDNTGTVDTKALTQLPLFVSLDVWLHGVE